MRRIIDDYGEPAPRALRSPARYLWWVISRQPVRAGLGALLGSVWMVALTVPPYVLSRAIDDGLVAGRIGPLLGWSVALLAVSAVIAWVGIMRHRTMTRLRMSASLTTARAVTGHAVQLGVALPGLATAGEAVTIGSGDLATIASSLTFVGPGFGAIVAYVGVALLLLAVSWLLAAVVVLGVPLLMLIVGPLLGRLHGAADRYRTDQGELIGRFVDIAGGLRVLGGLGGKEVFAQGYRRRSAALRAEGYRVGAATSWIEAFGVGLPALFLGVVTWIAARMVAQGQISVGELIAVYGYVAVLVVPVAFLIECTSQLSQGLVAAGHVVAFLRLAPPTGPSTPSAPPSAPSVLADPDSGVTVRPRTLTALVSARTADAAAVVDRLGGLAGSATWGGKRLAAMPSAQVRERILVADNEAHLFAGTLRDVVAGRRDPADAQVVADVRASMQAAMAVDVGGPDAQVDPGGLNLSGGQRQRVRLARALCADPEVLLAVEPTSALDAHTEAAVATRLRAARRARTTLVTTTSPLLLAHADTVHFLVDGRVVASGTHDELLTGHPGYRGLAAREEEDGG